MHHEVSGEDIDRAQTTPIMSFLHRMKCNCKINFVSARAIKKINYEKN
jgi:hypothetical protein